MEPVHPSTPPPSLAPTEARGPLLPESRPTDTAVPATPLQDKQSTFVVSEEDEFLGPVIDHTPSSHRERQRLLARVRDGLADRSDIDPYNS